MHNTVSIVEYFWVSTKILKRHVLKCVYVQDKEQIYEHQNVYLLLHVTVYHNINKI